MKIKYLPKTTGGKLGRLSEESAEVIEAVSKTLRLHLETGCGIEAALESGNPELPLSEFETNRDWILREVQDLEHAIQQIKEAISNPAQPTRAPWPPR